MRIANTRINHKMRNKVSCNLFIIIIILIIYGWILLPICATDFLQPIKNTTKKLFSGEIANKATPQEFVLSHSSNILGNLINTNKNMRTELLNYSTSPPPTAITALLKGLEIAANDVFLDESVKIHNNFYYGINKSNLKNNSNNNQKQPTPSSLSNNKFVNTSTLLPSSSVSSPTPSPSPPPSPSTSSSSSSSSAFSASSPSPSTRESTRVSSYFERVEMHETLTHTKNEKLLLHRSKRYLLFPEGSSFQLVFDLIIPIVDYTNFAIMGITCAVAWELPSKPPSEIIDNFRTKLNDGTFGLSRRNDSIHQPLEYINSLRTQQESVEDDGVWREDMALHGHQHYLPPNQQHQQLPASSTTTSGHTNYLTYAPKPLLPQSSSFYYNKYRQRDKIQQQQSSANSTIFSHRQYPQYQQQQQHQQQKWHNSNFETFDNNQRKTLYVNNNRRGQPIYRNNFAPQATKRLYYKDHHQQHHQHHYPATNTWNAESTQQKIYHHQQPHQMNVPYSQVGRYGNNDSWWEQNKNRMEKHWQQIKPKWTQYEENPQMNNQTPMFSRRTGRNRKILNKRPKHLIYPIFGKRKRRRRRSSADHNSDLNKKLQEIHAREHLRTRQKLYGKIEKLYKTRGYNGTACVLRALCETERVHLNSHSNERPQSFVMELLRSIFALPQDTTALSNSKESLLHLDARYADAVLLAHDVTQSCGQKYNDCEYGITYDT